jgi:organic radical activating enzyme
LSVELFDSFHNSEKKLADRKLMLQDQWPGGGCEYCQKIEQAGGVSDRLFHLQIPGYTPVELETDPVATEVSPRIVEVYLDNVCNMSCIYCWDGFSSQIQQENSRHGRFEQQNVVIDNRADKVNNLSELTDKFWTWLTNNASTLRRLNILGGEPLYQPQLESCLKILENHHWPELEFNIVSNLMVKDVHFKKVISRIQKLVDEKRIKRFDLTVSIDCFGPEQEYVRYGLDLDQWRRNFEYVVDCSWIYLNFNQTITSLTIKTMPDLLQYINTLRSNAPQREINQHFSTVVGYDYLHPGVFGPNYFDKDFNKILETMPCETEMQKNSKAYMQGIINQINNCSRQPEKIQQLVVYLTEIDRRRSLDWQKTFSWLTEEAKHVV